MSENDITLVMFKINKDNDKRQLFEAAIEFFNSDEWRKFLISVEASDLDTAHTLKKKLSQYDLGYKLRENTDKLLETIIRNPKFVLLVKNIAFVNCEIYSDACENRIEDTSASDDSGIVLQLYG